MKTSIFIKTCRKDLEWLKYCLQSIWKFGSGFEEVVIVADESCRGAMEALPLKDARVVYVEDWRNGYIFQQWVKLNADSYTQSEGILFVDSDCVFHTEFLPELFMRDGKPILLKTKYGNLEGAEAWRAITEAVVGWPVEYEYMRRLPMMYRRDTLIAFRNAFPELQKALTAMVDRSFSEFNCLGSFVDRFEQDKYHIVDTEAWIPPSVLKQFWSWSGLTTNDRNEIEAILR